MRSRLIGFIPFIMFAIVVFFLARGLSLDPHHLPSARENKKLPMFHLPELFSKNQFSPDLWRGKMILLNVWASWCSACIDEQLFLQQLAQKGVAIYGLNYKDKSGRAKKWLNDWGNPYQAIGEDKQGLTAINLGVYGTPETFLVDANGYIRFRYAGSLNADVWQKEFLPRMGANN